MSERLKILVHFSPMVPLIGATFAAVYGNSEMAQYLATIYVGAEVLAMRILK